ncbi:MAG: fucose isomerase [Candidatus Abyssobacteria bacterium SURF_17]|jgi:L-fucose isomerase-like protein|uniref:Fucose isomerase n=1 Tax=Candidatus Abyssobacteria bacterium SURF_17 TaxID=2093361 RepID=A0A419EP49_9BACT|nr:MAG: fucose isomerase [Candidatus Abyssubacteria bacterium SURF_17]
MRKRKFRLGYAPTRRVTFSKEEAGRYRKLILKAIKGFGVEVVDINWLNDEGLLFDIRQADEVAKRFRHEFVDAVFVPHCNFGTEEAVGRLGKKLGLPLLLWGPRDDAPGPDGLRLRDTQCGLFATSKVLRRMNVPFTYIVNSRLDEPVFERGFKNFVAAASAANAFKNMRIGQVAPRPKAFWTMMCNEGELLERFGLEVVPITLSEIVERVKAKVANSRKAIVSKVRSLKTAVDTTDCSEESLQAMVGLKLVLQEWAEEEGLRAIALQCWTAMQDALGVVPCFINGLLTSEGLPVTCETDVHGAATAILLQALALDERPIFFADLTIRHPKRDNAELLWHCGNFPLALKDAKSPTLACHYIMEGNYPGCGEFRLKEGPVTIARMDGDHGEYSLLMGEAKTVAGPLSRGTYVWVEVGDWPLWEERIIRGPYVHHVAAIYGQFASALYEACRYIPGLKPDAVEPTESEIQAWLRGR